MRLLYPDGLHEKAWELANMSSTVHGTGLRPCVIQDKLEGVLDGIYPATAEHLEPVLEETRLLTHLVEDLRLLALAEAGELALERRAMDVGDLLRDVQVNFSPQADDRGVTLTLSLPSELPRVMADWRCVAQVLGNLLTNALRHTPQGGCVSLSARAGGGMVEVSVADTGIGIGAEDLPYIFERFWRGERSRSRAGGPGWGWRSPGGLWRCTGGNWCREFPRRGIQVLVHIAGGVARNPFARLVGPSSLSLQQRNFPLRFALVPLLC